MSWFGAWVGDRLGRGATKAMLAEPKSFDAGPIKQKTEEGICADEARYDADARRLHAEDAAAKRRQDP